MIDIPTMAKDSPSSAKYRRGSSGQYRVVGRSSDGVQVLQPKTGPSSFRSAQAQAAVKSYLATKTLAGSVLSQPAKSGADRNKPKGASSRD